MRALFSLSFTFILTIGVPVVSAQTTWADHARVSVNFGVQPTSTTFTGDTTRPVYLETSTITTTYGVANGQLFDGGILVRVARSFGVGVAVSSFSKRQDASVAGTIPHPFFYNTPRSISGTVSTQRKEVVAHIQAAYVIVSNRLDVAVSGGPSIFSISQDLLSDVTYSELYPYDAATFVAGTVVNDKATKVGFNVGTDVGFKISRNLGVGGLVRFARASLSLPLTGSAAGVNVEAGGVQVGGGLRLFF